VLAKAPASGDAQTRARSESACVTKGSTPPDDGDGGYTALVGSNSAGTRHNRGSCSAGTTKSGSRSWAAVDVDTHTNTTGSASSVVRFDPTVRGMLCAAEATDHGTLHRFDALACCICTQQSMRVFSDLVAIIESAVAIGSSSRTTGTESKLGHRMKEHPVGSRLQRMQDAKATQLDNMPGMTSINLQEGSISMGDPC
jgi:hypothetical protein